MAFKRMDAARLLRGNSYPGRGIVVGKSSDGKKALFVYFIMGRSENSRNRVFREYGDELKTEPFDASKVKDPSLIIYSAVKRAGGDVIVTNGDQTDTVEAALKSGRTFRQALEERTFEPDAPLFTPRISAILHLGEKDFCYETSILKCADGKGKKCNRFFFSYEAVSGAGHMLHTYLKDGNPPPSFRGEPVRVKIPNDANEFARSLWDALDEDNKIALYCRSFELKTGKTERILINKYER